LIVFSLCFNFVFADLITTYRPYHQFEVDPDFDRDVPQLITSKGYSAEVHSITTEDGFILGVQRIPSAHGSVVLNPTPVVLMHGLLDSSAAWVLNNQQESLAYVLADAGYDVWLPNSRGNFYSRNHTTYDPKDKQFWAFSFDEMGKYDVPAIVDYILAETNHTALTWLGHSQGTAEVFAALSSQPSLNDKINLFIGLAPVTYVGNSTSIIVALAKFDLDELFLELGIKEFLPSTKFIHTIGKAFCDPFPELCEDFIFLICGVNSSPYHNLNASRMSTYISHTPAGTSVQNMVHWATHIRRNNFAWYDYGSDAINLAHYNTTVPPDYDLSKITTKLAVFTGTNDALATPKDTARTLSELSSDVLVFSNNQDEYQHLDFTWGMDDHVKIFPSILDLLAQYNSPQEAQASSISTVDTVVVEVEEFRVAIA